jgi:stage II sporulation protein D
MSNIEPTIHVGILTDSQIIFVLNGRFWASNSGIYSGRQVVVYRKGYILFDGKKLEDIVFEPLFETDSFNIRNVPIGIGFHWERRLTQRFKGNLKFITERGMLTAINLIGTEEYLTSVISSEMSATASEEMLKAHAVISRSWLLNPILNPEKNPSHHVETMHAVETMHDPQQIIKWYERDAHTRFNVCADDHCQRYQGITQASTVAVKKAIETTHGEVLMYDGQICDTRFSKSCGGASETFENCWANEHHPYLTKVIDSPTAPEGFEPDLTVEANAEKWIRNNPEAFCNTTDKQVLAQVLNDYDQETTDFCRWKVDYTQAELSEIIERRSGFDFGEIVDLIPIKRGESGRIIELKIIGIKQTVIVGKELEIRKWLSNSHLYSSAFVVDKSDIVDGIPQHFTLSGAGWGHGVGLCQIGAAVMGEKGYKYDEILLHYFQGAELKKIY